MGIPNGVMGHGCNVAASYIQRVKVRMQMTYALFPNTTPTINFTKRLRPLARNGKFKKNAVTNIFLTVRFKTTQLHIFRGL